MSNQIFLSHSRRDREVLRPIFDVLAKSSFKTYQADFEGLEENPAEELRRQINRSRLLILILGPNAADLEHTKMWISWEIGVMTQVDNPIWVIEEEDNRVNLPVPNLTDYLIWNSEEKEQRKQFRDIIEAEYSGSRSVREKAIERLEEHRNQIDEIRGDNTQDHNRIVCPECDQVFRLRSDVSELMCPTCLEGIKIVPGR